MNINPLEIILKTLSKKRILPLEDARKNRTQIEWDNYFPPTPNFIGTRNVEVSVETLIPHIDWMPYFFGLGIFMENIQICWSKTANWEKNQEKF